MSSAVLRLLINVYVHRTYKKECNAMIMFKLSTDKQSLELTEMNLHHNHEIDRREFEHHPHQRRLNEDVSYVFVYILC